MLPMRSTTQPRPPEYTKSPSALESRKQKSGHFIILLPICDDFSKGESNSVEMIGSLAGQNQRQAGRLSYFGFGKNSEN